MKSIEIMQDILEYKEKLQEEISNMRYILYYVEKSPSTKPVLAINDKQCVVLNSTWEKLKVLIEEDKKKLEEDLRILNTKLKEEVLVTALQNFSYMYDK